MAAHNLVGSYIKDKPQIASPISLTPNLVAEFWGKVTRRQDGCWLWGGDRSRAGYGKVQGHTASRVSFAIHYYEPPCDMMVCHHCDNPECTRPDHLFLGTAKDNSEDAVKKGRTRKGSAGLPDRGVGFMLEQTVRILDMGKRGRSNEEIATEIRMPARMVKGIRDQYSYADGGTGRRIVRWS